MNQLFAILWDSYRLLIARKLFWITLVLSLLIALLYTSISLTSEGVSLFFGLKRIDAELLKEGSPLGEYLYLLLFTDYLVPWWLGGGAIVLSLISVCPIFPEFLKKGSIDIAVSKPISRVLLFWVKYLGCLLFVIVQVSIFCLICFVTIGLRLGEWSPNVFLAIPLLVLAFSCIYCVAVLVSIKTESMIFSLLMAVLVWGISSVVMLLESGTYFLANNPVLKRIDGKGRNGVINTSKRWHPVIEKAAFPLPKSFQITKMMKRKLEIDGKGMTSYIAIFAEAFGLSKRKSAFREEAAKRHSDWYLIGTSLGFNVVILIVGCWMFVRRDY